MPTPSLFEPLTIRSVTFRNRIGVSPMCQYSCEDGLVTGWHLVHLGSRAVGGAALVMTEASAISPQGRISPADAGIWKDEHVAAWRPIARFISDHGAVPGMQLAHAGWKGSTAPPWRGGGAIPIAESGWQPLGVGSTPFADGYPTPKQLSETEIDRVTTEWRDAALRALDAGFRVIEIHAAHGYLLHSFLSPLSNRRADQYGGSFENRARLLLRVARELRTLLPAEVPLFVRLSCSDWTPGGWAIDDSVRLAAVLREIGVDLIDCSSGGAVAGAKISSGPGYQTAFADVIRRKAGVRTAAVGMITAPHQAETILRTGQADMVFLARELLRDPYWPGRAASALGVKTDGLIPVQYARAW
jgi:2,4-dienoyl-CoA reductase-like NADH-dependent reductase (Old Yellow Enzyme family)